MTAGLLPIAKPCNLLQFGQIKILRFAHALITTKTICPPFFYFWLHR